MSSCARLAILLACGLLACGPADSRPASAAPSGRPVPVPRSPAELDALLARLPALAGRLTPDWAFEGDAAVFEAVAALSDSAPALADSAVARLVECLGRPEPAAVTLGGRAVPVGVVCYQALTRLAYHEEPGPDGGLTPEWAGFIDADAGPEALRAAQRAWRAVVRERTYRFL